MSKTARAVIRLLVSICCAYAAPTAAASALTFEGDRVTLQLERGDDFLLVPVRIGDADAGLFIVDTGFSFTAIDRSLADELQLPTLVDGSVNAVGGSAKTTFCSVPSLTLGAGGAGGGVAGGARVVTAIDMSEVRAQTGCERLRGFLGGDVLRDAPFTIDWRSATLTFYARRGFAPPDRVEAQPLLVSANHPLIRVTLEGELSAFFAIDTGSNDGISLAGTYALVCRPILRGRASRPARVLGAGGGIVDQRETVFADAAFLATRATDVSVKYSLNNHRTGAPAGDAGQIGWDLLRPLRLTFDYANGLVWAERHADDASARPAEWDRPGFDPARPDSFGFTPLVRAARNGWLTDVERFLAAGVDVTTIGGLGATALHEAAQADDGGVAGVNALLAAGAPVDVKSREQLTPLQGAARSGNVAALAALIEAGADVESSDIYGRTALIHAANHGQAAAAAALLAAGADAGAESPNGSALHAAAAGGYVEVARALLAAGVDVDAVPKRNPKHVPTPLIVAAKFRHTRMMALLLEHGAEPDAIDVQGRSALHWAAWDPEPVEALLARGADPSRRDVKRLTPMEAAAAGGWLSTEVALLLHDATTAATAEPEATGPE